MVDTVKDVLPSAVLPLGKQLYEQCKAYIEEILQQSNENRACFATPCLARLSVLRYLVLRPVMLPSNKQP